LAGNKAARSNEEEAMRTGNAIFDVLIRVVAIGLIAAIIVWILGILDAPSIVGTIIWILALLAMAAVIFPLVISGGGFARGDQPLGRSVDPTVPPGARSPAEDPTAPTASRPPPAEEPAAPTRRPPPAA
jgi:hypothetical protein